MAESERAFDPDWASPPGDTIKDLMREKGISIETFAKRLPWMPLYQIQGLLEGGWPIDESLAFDLSRILGSSKQFWLNRQRQYDIDKRRLRHKRCCCGCCCGCRCGN